MQIAAKCKSVWVEGGRRLVVCVEYFAGNVEYRVIKFGTLRKSALTEVLLFCANAPDNFLEMYLDIKREG